MSVTQLDTSGALGHQNGLALLDQIHLAVLLFILLTASVAVISRMLRERG